MNIKITLKLEEEFNTLKIEIEKLTFWSKYKEKSLFIN